MEWIRSTMEWATTVLEQMEVGPAALPVTFLVGLPSAIACTCCTLLLPQMNARTLTRGLARLS